MIETKLKQDQEMTLNTPISPSKIEVVTKSLPNKNKQTKKTNKEKKTKQTNKQTKYQEQMVLAQNSFKLSKRS